MVLVTLDQISQVSGNAAPFDQSAVEVNHVLHSTCKCNSLAGPEGQATEASPPFKSADMRGADKRLDATRQRRTIPDLGAFDSKSQLNRDGCRVELSQAQYQMQGQGNWGLRGYRSKQVHRFGQTVPLS